MNTQRISPFTFTVKFLIVLHLAQNGWSGPSEMYETCGNTFSCGESITEIGYPFRGLYDPPYCGHPSFVLNCDSEQNITNIDIMGAKYRVHEIDQPTQTMIISREDIMNTTCPTQMVNTTLDYSIFDFAAVYANVTFFYGCPDGKVFIISDVHPISCGNNNIGDSTYVVGGAFGPGMCKDSVIVPAPVPGNNVFPNATGLDQILRQGFQIRWKIGSQACFNCTASKGRCGYDLETNRTACYCPDPPYVSERCLISNVTAPPQTPSPGQTSPARIIIIGVVLGVTATIILAIVITFCYLKRRRSSHGHNQVSSRDIEKFLLQYGSLSLKRYKYSEIKKITKSFSDKLGRGGYGSVYKGVLPDGSLVAVKVLMETDSDGEEFLNEVASISRTSHVNIVNLLGFCYDGKKRALVYQYMPNKSLDKFIGSSGSRNNADSPLDIEALYKIAIGVAKGLEYLHTGCNTRIVHFDIKPQNILLDEEFCPKISDFGLARLCKKKQSVFSMLGTRGTIGYISPEVFSRNYGGVSHKSDVYSYGMMILEMAGGTNTVEVDATQSSENYFPDKIYEQVIDVTPKLDDIMMEDAEGITRKMLLVGFWCIQTTPSDRPPMSKVVEMLEGSLQAIQIPPKPVLFTPTLAIQQLSSSFPAYGETEKSDDCDVAVA